MAAKKSAKSKSVASKKAPPAKKPAKSPIKKVAEVAKKLLKPAKALKKVLPTVKTKPVLASKALKVAPKGKKEEKKLPLKKEDLKKTKGLKIKEIVAVEVSSTIVVKKGKGTSAVPIKAARELKKRCRESGCDNDVVVVGFCRLHYIKNWKKIKRKEAILATGQLNNYVDELVSKYPDKYLDVIRQDLASEKDWSKVVLDLELDSDTDDIVVDEESDSGSTEGAGRVRDFDDDSDSF